MRINSNLNINNLYEYNKYIFDDINICLDITKLDLSNLTDLSGTFRSLEYFNQDISNWNVSNVTNMSKIFEYAILFNQPIAKWNVSKVENMSWMFHGATEFNQPIGGGVTTTVKQVSSENDLSFSDETVYNINKGWTVSNVRNLSGMFTFCNSFKQYLGDWVIENSENKPFVCGLSFDANNEKYKFSKYRLIQFIENYQFNETDQSKYDIIKYCKQYSQHDNEEFINIINELKDKNIKLDITI